MLRGYRLVIAALGLALFAGPVLGQELDQPNTTTEQNAAQSASEESGQSEQSYTDRLAAIFERIETAISNLKPIEDSDQNQTNNEREIRDLKAQEGMAKWAFWMFVATAVTVLLTFFALVAILRTLYHTRRAADAAVDMVAEAKQTTKAAFDSASAANKQADFAEESFRKMERPYVLPGEIGPISWHKTSDEITHYWVVCGIANYGKTPAIIHYVLDSIVSTPDRAYSDPDSGIRKLPLDYNVSQVLPAGGSLGSPHKVGFPAVVKVKDTRKHRVLTIRDKPDVYLVINIKFEDVMGIIRIGRFTWKFSPNHGRFLRYGGSQYNYEKIADS